MPIVAMLDGEQVIGPLASPELWEQCKKTAKTNRDRLIMRATGEPCFPRRSRAGLPHFAHYAGTQATAPESIGHEMLKTLVAKTLQTSGWSAELEVPQDNREWIADVLGVSPTGSKVAFEIQLSQQTVGETSRRTERYTKSGIHTVWITPDHGSIPKNVDAIILNMSGGDLKKIKTLGDTNSIPAKICHNTDQWDLESIPPKPLGEVLQGILGGKTTYPPKLKTALVYAYPCWSCRKPFTSYEGSGREIRVWKTPEGKMVVKSWANTFHWEDLNHPDLIQVASETVREIGLPPLAGTTTGEFTLKALNRDPAWSFRYKEDSTVSGTYLTCPHCSARQGRAPTLRERNFKAAERSGLSYEVLFPIIPGIETTWEWGTWVGQRIFQTGALSS